jgi:hypothetical protein
MLAWAKEKMSPENLAEMEARHEELRKRRAAAREKDTRRTWFVNPDGEVVGKTELTRSVRPAVLPEFTNPWTGKPLDSSARAAASKPREDPPIPVVVSAMAIIASWGSVLFLELRQ